ncbi:MAG: DUF302 domain-containing protein [Actinobacteria bacterium]|nr:DUF302 domain-containing protein [Actinomycetota bacterium]MCG2807980.1 DUF302 domain-containing protein [Coriobacteriia bacterium]
MTEMAYVQRSNASLTNTVEALEKAAEDARWVVLATHDMKARFEKKGFDWDCGLTIVEICQSKFATAMVLANPHLALHLPCPIVVREDADGVEVSVLKATFVAGLFPDTDFGEEAADAEASVTAIVDAAVA